MTSVASFVSFSQRTISRSCHGRPESADRTAKKETPQASFLDVLLYHFLNQDLHVTFFLLFGHHANNADVQRGWLRRRGLAMVRGSGNGGNGRCFQVARYPKSWALARSGLVQRGLPAS